jgi:hypothetical protein
MRFKAGIGVLFLSGATAALLAQSSTSSQPSSSQSQPSQSTQSTQSQPSNQSMDTSRSSATMKAPMSASDCTNDAWRNYSSPKFKSEKACQSYVTKHMKKGTTGDTNAPHGDMSTGTGANTGTNPDGTSARPKPTPHP